MQINGIFTWTLSSLCTWHLPFAHLGPILPRGHWHSPVSGEQVALTQLHRWPHSIPYVPRGQTVRDEKKKIESTIDVQFLLEWAVNDRAEVIFNILDSKSEKVSVTITCIQYIDFW